MRTWNRDTRLTCFMLALVCLGAASAFLWTAEKGRAILVRTLEKDLAKPVDLSSDGQFILTIGERKNPERPGARLSVLAVFDTKKGKAIGKPVIEADWRFATAIFDGPQRVLALKTTSIYPHHASPVLLEWDFVAGKLSERPVRPGDGLMPACILNDRQFAGVVYDRDTPKGRPNRELLAVSEENGVRVLRQPSVISYDNPNRLFHSPTIAMFGDNCRAWKWKDNFLLANANPGDLHWISIQPEKDPIRCHSFPGEIICGQTVSPDGSLVAVVTIDREIDKLARVAEAPSVFLYILQAQTCKPAHRFLLEFPEKPVWRRNALSRKKYMDNHLFLGQLASKIAISPDNTKLALSYGIYRSSDGIAYFGLYSLSDGRRLTTLRGNINRGGFWQGILKDEIWASSAPLAGILQFSPDSRMLYAGSKGVFQWDVSGVNPF